MNYIKDINLGEFGNPNMIIEIPKGTNKKFELVEPNFDRVECNRQVIGRYPFYYGCFPQTLAGDGDPLDCILISNEKHESLDIVKVIPFTVIKTLDNGEVDDKILCIETPIKNLCKSYKKVMKFLKSYKGKHADTIIDKTLYDVAEPLKLIREANELYIAHNKDVQNILENIKVGM